MELNIKDLRKQHNLTQEQLAEKAGVSRLTIINLETGKVDNVSGKTLKSLSDALGCTIDDLFSSQKRLAN
ncbi:MAG: helix-turn-helix transcriptional regulator [Galactobacillus timonensis]|uniref:helix-turn-helix transcriptional regulator n=1 Tax=Galactobacillus timonensis TaxID=2041840 RepID=UPI0023F1757B|nr:helix-turn-helix transcriptional regulator [Galactobacillus timonensis]MCI6068197.1 helix-turn-helix transcriptional regulator [Galactobacillus timonensis]